MYQTCSFRATTSQKYNYLIQHYAISGFGWTYLYLDFAFNKTSKKRIIVETF